MTRQLIALKFPFSTADASNLSVRFGRESFQIGFRDWREQVVIISFQDVIAFRWDEGDFSIASDQRDDVVYEASDSDWLESHIRAGTVTREEGHRHFILCFNAIGVLEVLATQLKL